MSKTVTTFSFDVLACGHPTWWCSLRPVASGLYPSSHLQAAWLGSSCGEATLTGKQGISETDLVKMMGNHIENRFDGMFECEAADAHFCISCNLQICKRDTGRECRRISACCKIFKRPESDQHIPNFYNKQGRGCRASIMAFLARVSILVVTCWPKEEWIMKWISIQYGKTTFSEDFFFLVADFCWW